MSHNHRNRSILKKKTGWNEMTFMKQGPRRPTRRMTSATKAFRKQRKYVKITHLQVTVVLPLTHSRETGKIWEFPSSASSGSTMMSMWELKPELVRLYRYAFMCQKGLNTVSVKARNMVTRSKEHSHTHICIWLLQKQAKHNEREDYLEVKKRRKLYSR